MRPRIHVLLLVVLGVLATGGPKAAPATSGETTTARAQASRLLSLDVWVRDLQGQPVPNLNPRDFVVQVDGRERRVTSAEFLDYTAGASTPRTGAPSAPLPGRTIAIVIDDLSFEGDNAAPLGDAAARWLERLHPSDRVAIVRATAGRMPVTASPSADAAALVRSAVAVSRSDAPPASHDAEFLIERRTLDQAEALARAISWLAAERGPRVLVLLSKGLVVSPSAGRYLSTTYQIARDAGISGYVVAPATAGPSPAGSGWNSVPVSGPTPPGPSLDQIAAGMNARLIRAQTRADDAFDEVQRAVSGVYRLEVEAPATAPLPHFLPVTISMRPVTLAVRAARLVIPPAGLAAPRTSAERTRDILTGVDVASDIAIDATTTLSPDGSSADGLELTISVVLPHDLASPVRVAFGVLDETGAVRYGTVDVPDATDGARRTSVAIPVAPGWHRLTLVAEDGNQRLGSLSRAVHAKLRAIGPYALAEPRVLWRTDANTWQVLGDEALPDDAVVAASVFELYANAPGREPPPLPLRLEDDTGREVATQTLTPARAGQGWRLSGEVRLDRLAQGDYVFRLDTTALGDGGGPLTLRFRKTTPASVAAAPAPPPLPAAADVLNLFRAGVRDNWPRATRDDLLLPELLTPQLKALAGSRPLPAGLANATGDDWWTALRAMAKQPGAAGLAARGLAALRDNDARAAETHLRDAVAASPSSNAPRRLLGVAFAATGRDEAAAGVWSLAAGERAADPRWTLAFAESLGRIGDYRAALDMLRQMPGAPTGRRLDRLVEALIVVGLMDEATTALVTWEAGEGREQPDGRLTFYLVALRYIAALQPSADAQTIDAFRNVAERYVTAGGEYADLVTPWLQSAVALER